MAVVLKPRVFSNEISTLRSLQSRMPFVTDDSRRYLNLEKGLAGELRFDQLTEELRSDGYLLHDLRLEHQHSFFQIDTLLISGQGILLFEIKNFEGDFVYEDETFRLLATKQEILNPLHQLNRCVTLLRSLLKKLGVDVPVKGYLVFVNPQFTLYQAPVDAPVILPSQIQRFIQRLDQSPSTLSRKHKELADQLVERHVPEFPFERLPEYHFAQLKKGILCESCCSFMAQEGRTVKCKKCGTVESLDSSILRSIEELMSLFPDQPITTSLVYEWCRIIESPKPIRRILKQHFQPVGSCKQRRYVIRE